VRAVRKSSPATTAIVLSPRKAYDAAVGAFRAGAADIVVKSPEQVSYLLDRVSQATRDWRRERDRDALMLEVGDVHEGFLRRMRELYRTVIDFQDRLQGRDILADFQLPECRVLVVDDDPALPAALVEAFKRRDDGWVFSTVQSGGEALDLGGREKYHVALIKNLLPDLPGSMVVSTLRAQSPETIYLHFAPPGSPGAKVEVKEVDRDVVLVPEFTEVAQLAGRLDEIRDAFKAKARERRYLQSFRTAQFDFLKQYAELKKAIDAAKAEMDARAVG
jgi:DNA-binding response OmpR family regulator